ncbi:MAG TPA: hypothetical protein VFS62_07820, partial [Chloroflexota bacterium]|nr:hypothetical protein [Chloroflexota bacterium]
MTLRNAALSLLSLAAVGLAGCGTSTSAAPPAAVQQAPNIQTFVNGSPVASPDASPVADAAPPAVASVSLTGSAAASPATQPPTIAVAQAPEVDASPSLPAKPIVPIKATPDAMRLSGFVY